MMLPQKVMDDQLPIDEDLEARLLGSLLLDWSYLDEVKLQIAAEDFYEYKHRYIFQAMIDIHKDGLDPDYKIVEHTLKKRDQYDACGGVLYLMNIQQLVIGSDDSILLAPLLKEKSKLRKIIEIARTAERQARDLVDSPVIMDKLTKSLQVLSTNGVASSVKSASDVAQIVSERVLARCKGDVSGDFLKTPWSALNEILSPGIDSTSLVVLAARPSIGKSAMAAFISDFVAEELQKPALIHSVEMSAEQIIERLLAKRSGQSLKKIRGGELDHFQQSLIESTANEYKETPLFIDDDPNLSVEKLKNKIRIFQSQHPTLGLVVVDYLQIMKRPDSKRSTADVIGEMTSTMKQTAKEMNVPIILLSQFSREFEKANRRPRLSDLRDSGSIEQDADVVLMMYPGTIDAENNFSDHRYASDGSKNIVLEVGKNRSGSIGSIPLSFYGWKQSFGYIHRDFEESPI